MDRSHNRGLWAWWSWRAGLDNHISLAGFIAGRVWAESDRADQQRVVLLNVWGCSQSPQKCIQVTVANLNITTCDKIQHTIIWVNYTMFKRFQIRFVRVIKLALCMKYIKQNILLLLHFETLFWMWLMSQTSITMCTVSMFNQIHLLFVLNTLSGWLRTLQGLHWFVSCGTYSSFRTWKSTWEKVIKLRQLCFGRGRQNQIQSYELVQPWGEFINVVCDLCCFPMPTLDYASRLVCICHFACWQPPCLRRRGRDSNLVEYMRSKIKDISLTYLFLRRSCCIMRRCTSCLEHTMH